MTATSHSPNGMSSTHGGRLASVSLFERQDAGDRCVLHGVEHTMDVPIRALGQSLMPGTAYLDPGDPSPVTFSRPLTKWIEAVVVLGSHATSALLLEFGFARRSRRSHRRARVNA